MSHKIRHPIGRKKDGFCALNLDSFARHPRSVIRLVYREMRRDGVRPMMARHYIMQLVMAADWPE